MKYVIEKGGVDFTHLGPALSVDFDAWRLIGGSVLWLNHRWFAEHGINVADDDARAEVEHWLLEDYAYLVPAPTDPPGIVNRGDPRTFRADRYGMTNGGWHGGSGRCGYRGRYNVKGIGPTPLVSLDADEMHSSGMMMLWEALMETILAEVAAAELPYGAIRTIAIIDAGFASIVPGSPTDERRALLVRPNFVRPGHMERSIFFGSGSVPNRAQMMDAQRVSGVVQGIFAGSGEPDERFLRTMILRDAHQLGAAHAHRLWLGIFASSNRTIKGELADFGALRTVPDWRCHFTVPPERFGRELPLLFETVGSLLFHVATYGQGAPMARHPPIEVADLATAVADGFRTACTAATGCSEAVSAALYAIFTLEQHEDVPSGSENWQRPWLPEALASDQSTGSASYPELAQLIDQEGLRAAGVRSAIRRWLHPRRSLAQSAMAKELPAFVRSLEESPAARRGQVERHVRRQLSLTRRHWPERPATLRVKAQACGIGIDVLFGEDEERRTHGAWVVVDECGPWSHLAALPGATTLSSKRVATWLDSNDWEHLKFGTPSGYLLPDEGDAFSFPD
ncbi:MAG: hypothetical protein ABI810_15420 [Sphingomonas bacterium]